MTSSGGKERKIEAEKDFNRKKCRWKFKHIRKRKQVTLSNMLNDTKGLCFEILIKYIYILFIICEQEKVRTVFTVSEVVLPDTGCLLLKRQHLLWVSAHFMNCILWFHKTTHTKLHVCNIRCWVNSKNKCETPKSNHPFFHWCLGIICFFFFY